MGSKQNKQHECPATAPTVSSFLPGHPPQDWSSPIYCEAGPGLWSTSTTRLRLVDKKPLVHF